jgi:DNA polymerase-1
VPPRRYWDTHYVEKALYSNYYDKFDLAALSRRWLRRPMDKEAREHFYDADRMTKEMVRYAARDAWTTLRVSEAQMSLCAGPEDPDGGTSAVAMVEAVWYGTDLPALWTVLDMRGVCINEAEWAAIADEQQAILDRARAKLKYNHASNKEVAARLLAEGIKLPKTDAGNYSVREEVLEDYKDKSATVREVLEFRSAQKFAGTYGRKFLGLVEDDGRIHAEFSIYGTETGRFSSDHPNLQNIPIRTEIGRRVRKAFVARPGCMLLSVDYSQVELRLVAHMAGDQTMLAAFRAGQDIHAATAAAVYGIPIGSVSKEQRRDAKAINFGLIYGMSAFGLTRTTELTLAEAEDFVEAYFKQFPGVKRYLDGMRQKAAEQGYVETLLGRRRYFPGLKDPHNQTTRGREEREAINAPIQGTAADILKIAMLRVPAALKEAGLAGRMLLQVHDELVLECPVEQAKSTANLVKNVMENAYQLSIPLQADARCGLNWDEMQLI